MKLRKAFKDGGWKAKGRGSGSGREVGQDKAGALELVLFSPASPHPVTEPARRPRAGYGA